MRKATRTPMVFGGAAVTLVGGLGGAVAMQGVAGAAEQVWAHNTTAIQVSIGRSTTSPSTFKAAMTNGEGSPQTGKLCVDFYTQTPTHTTQLKLESATCTSKETVTTGESVYTGWLQNHTWAIVEGNWKVSPNTQIVSHVEALTFHV